MSFATIFSFFQVRNIAATTVSSVHCYVLVYVSDVLNHITNSIKKKKKSKYHSKLYRIPLRYTSRVGIFILKPIAHNNGRQLADRDPNLNR